MGEAGGDAGAGPARKAEGPVGLLQAALVGPGPWRGDKAAGLMDRLSLGAPAGAEANADDDGSPFVPAATRQEHAGQDRSNQAIGRGGLARHPS